MKTQLITFFFFFFTLPSIFTQSQIEGAVSDVYGQDLAAVTVELVDISANTTLITTKTDKFGLFKLADIPSGVYEIQFSLTDYKAAKIENLYFPKNRDKYIGLSLEADKALEAIEKVLPSMR